MAREVGERRLDDHLAAGEARRRRLAAWAVHAFTASGVVLGGLALIATLEGDRVAAFLWLGLALLVDGIDGTLARKARVRDLIPQFDGATLDNVIDYFTYVVVPALMIYMFALVPAGWATWTVAFILAVSCYTFANAQVKTSDYYFEGFPALWNLVVLYLYVLQTGPWTNLVIIALCGIFTFVPLKYVHPLRVRTWRRVTVPVTIAWAATSLRLVTVEPGATAAGWIYGIWFATSAYFVALSLWRSLQPAR